MLILFSAIGLHGSALRLRRLAATDVAQAAECWSERRDLNPGPPVPQTGALTGLRYAPPTRHVYAAAAQGARAPNALPTAVTGLEANRLSAREKLALSGPRHPANERHGRQHPAETGDGVIEHLDHPVGLDLGRLRERHRQQRPRHHQNDQHDRAAELAQAGGHVCSIAGADARLYGPRRDAGNRMIA